MDFYARRVIGATVLIAAAFFTSVTSVAAAGFAGSYLAAGQADYDNDYRSAALFYARALADDPENPALMQSLLIAYVGEGQMSKALAVARKMKAIAADGQLAQLLLVVDDIQKGHFDQANAIFENGGQFSPLLDGLLRGWVYLGMGQMSEATAQFDDLASNGTMKVFSDYHLALALASVGDFEGANKKLSGEGGLPVRIGRRSLTAHIEILSQLERTDEALTMAKNALGSSGDPEVTHIVAELEAGHTLPFDVVKNAVDGSSEVFLTLAKVLSGPDNERFALIYGRIAELLRPDSVGAMLVVADLLKSQHQYDLASINFNKVPQSSPLYYNAEIGRADALIAGQKPDAGIEVLRSLAKAFPEIPSVFLSLGDALRQQSRFADARIAYNAAIDLLPNPEPKQWFLYYARGITRERAGEWDKAEEDFRFALKLSPDQPLVLNYLGYGLVEKGLKLDEAQKMIEVAVRKQPNDGYIRDSLGWVYFQLGKYEESVPKLERAVELLAVDPIINDHLGDAYWMVGRKLEAEFQWKRALSFKPEDKDAARIRRKLEVGLDQVRKVEAATAASND